MSLVVLDAGMANVALPSLARALDVTPAAAVLVVTAYQTGLVMALLPCGSLGARFGDRRVFQAGVSLFVLASALCALSTSLPWLVGARFLQGLGGAAIMALGVALLRSTVGSRRMGSAIGWNALTVALSAAAAPTLGALIIAHLDWTWLFIGVSLPIGGMVLLSARALPWADGQRTRLDLASMALNGAGFALLIAAVQILPRSLPLAVLAVCGAGLALAALVRREAPKAAPMVPLDLLQSPAFRSSVLASVLCFAATSAGLVALPFHLHHTQQLSPLMTGLYMSPWPLSVAVAATLSGRLSDRLSTARLCAIGGGVLAIGLAALAVWPPQGEPRPLLLFAAICGFGFGLFQTPNNRTLFLSAPVARSGAAGGMQGTARLAGQTAGAVFMALLFGALSMTAAVRVGFGFSAALALAAAVVSLRRR